MKLPVILDFAVDCHECNGVRYTYDHSLALNVLVGEGPKVIFIEADFDSVAMLTKSKVVNETDDSEISRIDLLTKTRVSNEQDDEPSLYRDITTKTLTSNESDDERNYYYQ